MSLCYEGIGMRRGKEKEAKGGEVMNNKTLKYMMIDWFKTIEHIASHYAEKDISPEQMLLEIGAMANRCKQFVEKNMEE